MIAKRLLGLGSVQPLGDQLVLIFLSDQQVF